MLQKVLLLGGFFLLGTAGLILLNLDSISVSGSGLWTIPSTWRWFILCVALAFAMILGSISVGVAAVGSQLREGQPNRQ